MAPPPRIRPYKDFLTPTLHRRFVLASATLFFICYGVALLIGEWNSFIWSWFPFGRAGIRTGLLFIPAFSIFLLRISQLHVGIRTSYSPYQTFTKYITRSNTIQTTLWYLFSAWLYSEIYIWSVSKSADLNRIKLIPKTDRPTLNEKPIYLTCFLYFLAITQAGVHLYHDYDRIDMPIVKAESAEAARVVVPPSIEFQKRLPGIVMRSLTRVVIVAVVSPFIYSLTIRNFAWEFMRFFAKIFWSLPKSSILPSIRPFHWSVLMRTVNSGLFLTLLWETGNALFSIYAAQAPLKNDRPITYESKDPNGSLLTGLKAKKLQTRVYAFWELLYIAQLFEGRRRNIYEDIDRKEGSTWSQILEACLETVTGIDSGIAEFYNPKLAATKIVPEVPIPTLPKMSQPLKDGMNRPGDLFTSAAPPISRGGNIIQAVGTFAKNHGQSPPQSHPIAQKMLKQAEGAVLTQKQRDELATQGPSALFKDSAIWFLRTSAGWPFRQEYRRRVATVILGSPYGDVGIFVDAIESLTQFAVKSLQEDKYGNVQRDVRRIIKTFTNTVTNLENFRNTIGFHWTDIERKQSSPETDLILTSLKSGLNELISAFGDYSEDLGLSQSEMRVAMEAATPIQRTEPEIQQPEMQQVG